MGARSGGSSFALHFAIKMMRSLYLFVLGFSGLFAMQGCGDDAAASTDTTAAAAETTTTHEPLTHPSR